MWIESRVTSYPLMFRRQFAQPIDVYSGFFTTSVLFELADGDSGTTILMQQDNGILLHPNFISLTYLDSIETCTSTIKPEIYFTRFDGEAEPITIYGYNSALKIVSFIYKAH